jgi:hypothetical protein
MFLDRVNDHLLRFFGGEECLWFFYLHLFSARITVVIFCHNDCLRRIYADPDRKGRSS